MEHERTGLARLAAFAGADRNQLWWVVLAFRGAMLLFFMGWDALHGWRWGDFPIGVATAGYLLVLLVPVLARSARARWARMRGCGDCST